MKKFVVLFLFSLMGSLSFAAFPPFAETAVYIKAALDDSRVVQELGITNAVESIFLKNSTITIVAGQCSLDIEIKGLPQHEPIPPTPTPQFELLLGKKVCQ